MKTHSYSILVVGIAVLSSLTSLPECGAVEMQAAQTGDQIPVSNAKPASEPPTGGYYGGMLPIATDPTEDITIPEITLVIPPDAPGPSLVDEVIAIGPILTQPVVAIPPTKKRVGDVVVTTPVELPFELGEPSRIEEPAAGAITP